MACTTPFSNSRTRPVLCRAASSSIAVASSSITVTSASSAFCAASRSPSLLRASIFFRTALTTTSGFFCNSSKFAFSACSKPASAASKFSGSLSAYLLASANTSFSWSPDFCWSFSLPLASSTSLLTKVSSDPLGKTIILKIKPKIPANAARIKMLFFLLFSHFHIHRPPQFSCYCPSINATRSHLLNCEIAFFRFCSLLSGIHCHFFV